MYELKTEQEYKEVKAKQVTYETWSEQFKQKNGWIIIPSNAIPPVKFDNDDRSAIELYEWKNNPPEKYFLYVKETNLDNGLRLNRADIHTWIGQSLGYAYLGPTYRDNFGGKRVSITVYGNNGVKYYGTYYKSSGDYARIKRIKNQ